MKSNKMLLFVLSIIIILSLLYVSVWSHDIIGVAKNKIEEDARKSQKIDENWFVAKDVNDKMAGLLFYDEEISHHVFSIYLNRDNFSLGYMFQVGGSLFGDKAEIQGISYQGKGMVLLSLNGKGIKEIKIENGVEIQTIQLDPAKPFVVIIPPSDDGRVSLYDINGENIAIDTIHAY